MDSWRFSSFNRMTTEMIKCKHQVDRTWLTAASVLPSMRREDGFPLYPVAKRNRKCTLCFWTIPIRWRPLGRNKWGWSTAFGRRRSSSYWPSSGTGWTWRQREASPSLPSSSCVPHNPALCHWIRSAPHTASIENVGYWFFMWLVSNK